MAVGSGSRGSSAMRTVRLQIVGQRDLAGATGLVPDLSVELGQRINSSDVIEAEFA